MSTIAELPPIATEAPDKRQQPETPLVLNRDTREAIIEIVRMLDRTLDGLIKPLDDLLRTLKKELEQGTSPGLQHWSGGLSFVAEIIEKDIDVCFLFPTIVASDDSGATIAFAQTIGGLRFYQPLGLAQVHTAIRRLQVARETWQQGKCKLALTYVHEALTAVIAIKLPKE